MFHEGWDSILVRAVVSSISWWLFLKKPLRSVEIAHYRCLEDTLICLHVLLKMIKQHGGNYVKFHKNVFIKNSTLNFSQKFDSRF